MNQRCPTFEARTLPLKIQDRSVLAGMSYCSAACSKLRNFGSLFTAAFLFARDRNFRDNFRIALFILEKIH